MPAVGPALRVPDEALLREGAMPMAARLLFQLYHERHRREEAQPLRVAAMTRCLAEKQPLFEAFVADFFALLGRRKRSGEQQSEHQAPTTEGF